MDELKRLLEQGRLSDWFQPRFNHVVSMTCGAFHNEFTRLPTWPNQLAELLVDLGVESTTPGDRTDSPGDRYVRLFWRDWGKTA